MSRAQRLAACLVACLACDAHATLCTPDAVPAATLLVPYFEVDLGSCNNAATRDTTRLWVRNTADVHHLAQVTLWSDYGVPVVGFPIYLPPLAARHVDLGEVICAGRVPSTGAAVNPPSDFGSEAPAPGFPMCNNTADPLGGAPVNPQFPPALIAEVQLSLTGERVPSVNACRGRRHGDGYARGYATIDVVQWCSTLFPDAAGYHAGVIGHDNVLVGGFEYLSPSQNFAEGAAAVPIEAGPADAFAAGEVTFYGRYLGFSGADRREPLPANWALPIRTETTNGQRSNAVIWREVPRLTLSSNSCIAPPAPLPLTDGGQVVFDATGQSGADPVPFPGQPAPVDDRIGLATQQIDTRDLDAQTPFAATAGNGMARLDLQYDSPVGNPPGKYGQSWVGTLRGLEGRFSDFTAAFALDSSCNAGKAVPANVSGPTLQNPSSRTYIFSNGLEP